MANQTSVDTWQDLERRFHEIGNLPYNIMLEFTEANPGEPIQWTLSPVKKGECHITLIGGHRAAAAAIQSQKYKGNEYPDGGELSDLMRRAGNLLVPHNPKNIWEGADLFVALTVKTQCYFVCTDVQRRFFPNAGRILGIMAGQMILKATETDQQSEIPATADSQLPFGLLRCDVPQTLKRPGFQPVTISNEDYWKLMQALISAYPNAVPESKLKQMFPYPNDRKNNPKKLRDIIDTLGLTVKKWTLIEQQS